MYYRVARSPLSRELLAIDWQYPVSAPPQVGPDGRTIAVEAERALELDVAFQRLAAKDPRPLLVLRECLRCAGTDDALLTRQADNEKTLLMSRWFRCVKLPPDVLEKDHPFHNLFAGDEPPHLFLARPDGTARIDLVGDQSRSELWKAMERHLDAHYADKPDPVLKKLARVLDEFDAMDLELRELNKKIDRAIEEDGPEDRKVKKLMAERKELLDERSELRDEAYELCNLKARKDPKKV